MHVLTAVMPPVWCRDTTLHSLIFFYSGNPSGFGDRKTSYVLLYAGLMQEQLPACVAAGQCSAPKRGQRSICKEIAVCLGNRGIEERDITAAVYPDGVCHMRLCCSMQVR